MAIKDKLKQLRKDKNWTQDQLAKITSINGRLIARYEAGGVEPSATTLRKLAEAFEVSVDHLLFDDVDDKFTGKFSDKELLKRFEILGKINGKEKELLLAMLDMFIRDHNIRQTYQEK